MTGGESAAHASVRPAHYPLLTSSHVTIILSSLTSSAASIRDVPGGSLPSLIGPTCTRTSRRTLWPTRASHEADLAVHALA